MWEDPMRSIRKKSFFLPVVMALAVAGTLIGLNINSPTASAAGACSQKGYRTVGMYDLGNGQTYFMGVHPYYQSLSRGSGYSSNKDCVKTLQTMANVYCNQDTRLQVDGEFGRRTYSAIKTIQNAFANNGYWQAKVNGSSISVDGQVGPQTWSTLQAFSFMGSPTKGGTLNCMTFYNE